MNGMECIRYLEEKEVIISWETREEGSLHRTVGI